VSTSKTGKHGHAKCHFVATDIFTSRKMEELVPSSHNLEVRSRQAAARSAGGMPPAVPLGRAASIRARSWPARPRHCVKLGQPAGCRAGRPYAAMRTALSAPRGVQVPHVSRQDYSLLDISDDGYVRAVQAPEHAAPAAIARCLASGAPPLTHAAAGVADGRRWQHQGRPEAAHGGRAGEGGAPPRSALCARLRMPDGPGAASRVLARAP
jgi:hypothetical protein